MPHPNHTFMRAKYIVIASIMGPRENPFKGDPQVSTFEEHFLGITFQPFRKENPGSLSRDG